MTALVRSLFIVMLLATAVTCSGSGERRLCVFNRPHGLVLIPGPQHYDVHWVVRRETDPTSLLFLHGLHHETNSRAAIRIDFATGSMEGDSVQYNSDATRPDEGYTFFERGSTSLKHALFASKTIRYEYLGRTVGLRFPNRNYDGRWAIASEKKFTGTRRLMYGNRPLLQQEFSGWTFMDDGVERAVSIEPDGDRIVCACYDAKGTWLALFSKSKLEAENKKMSAR